MLGGFDARFLIFLIKVESATLASAGCTRIADQALYIFRIVFLKSLSDFLARKM